LASCCSGTECKTDNGRVCPVSRTKGANVDLQTVKAMLTETALKRFKPATYHFCADPACEVVYFADDGDTFSKREVRVAVWHKEAQGARTVCYCFGENEADIRAELIATGRSEAVERVRMHIQAGRCACEVRNPRGVCCLGDVTAAVKRVRESFAPAAALSGGVHERFGSDGPDRDTRGV
jgi:endonuclease YncB( thermonuclease family)